MAAENELKGNDEMLVDSSSSEEDTDMLSGGNDSDDDDNVKNAKIEELQKQVDVNPYNYDHQIELLTVLRASGELDLLRNARNNMNKIFPLPPDIWKQWIEDEKKLASSTEEREAINQLFGRALEDYNSPDIWLEYVQFSIGDMQAKGANYVREVFEKALTAVGLHVTEANLLWTAYAEFEVAVLAGFQPKAGAVPTPEQNELVASQTKKVINVLKRHLSLPLEGIDESFEEYKSFVEEVDPTVQSNFRKAQEKLNILMPFEEALEDAKGPRTDAYKAYIKHELKGADPSRIQCIFERALIENCLIPDFWLKYGKYLDQDLRSRTAILKMYNRAVRNCPWSSDLWLLHIRALERFRYSEHDVIKDEFNKALKCNQLPEAADYLKVWQGYCDYMRRRIDWDEEDQTEKIEDLRKTFQQALDYLTQYYGKDGDPNCNLLQYWARIEAKFCKNMEKARENWNVVMQQGFGNQAQMWLEYFYLERSFGTHKHCRKILQRALNSVTDWPDYIVEAFITFEREEGTLEQYDQAMEKCDAQMARLAERKAKEMVELEKKKEQEQDMLKWSRMSRKRKRSPFCACCKTHGHEQLSYACDSLQDPPLTDVTPFKGKFDVLSNFYPCKVKLWGWSFNSTEHAYQYKKAIECNRPEIADIILTLTEARDVKIESNKIKTDEKWNKIRLDLFRDILQVKALYCVNYIHALLTAKKTIAEAVPGDDFFWSTGLSKEEVVYCKKENWPGANVMGNLHMEVRTKLNDGLLKCVSVVSAVPELKELCLNVTGPRRLEHFCYCTRKAAEKEALLEDQRNQQQRFKAKAKRPHQHEQMFVKQEDASPKAKVKRERVEPVKEEEVPKKEYPIKSGVAETVDKEGFKVPNPPSVKAPVAPPPGYQARKPAPPPGYKPDVEEPPDKRQKVDEHEETSPTKQSEEHSKRTVFVSNLDFHVKEADLTPLFMPYGDLKDIRLIKAMNGKSKGFGYVEFKEEGPVKKALQLDRTTVSGRPMFVSECKDKTERQVAFKYETKLEKKKLFIKNLPFSITKEALEKIFTEHGNVKDIRMVTYRSGQFKGLAYVEYDEEESASKAIMKTDGLKIGDFEISVAISNPPARKPQGQKKEESNFTPTLGGGKKEADRGGRAKTMLSFQPRSLQAKKALPTVQSKKPAAASKQTESENGTETDSSKKASLSNADFRSMLMK